VRIRSAITSDAPGLAIVGVDTWRNTYRGIMADEYLDNLSYERSETGWRERVADDRCFTYVAEDDSGSIVGYAHAGSERDGNPVYPGELYALYVQKESQGTGIGKELVRVVAERFVKNGIKSMIIWVLAANPSRGFYERLGGQMLKTKTVGIGGRQLEEIAYGWTMLDDCVSESY